LQFKASPGSNLSWKKISIKKRAGGVAQGVGPEFKSQYHKKKKKNASLLLLGFYCKQQTPMFLKQARPAVARPIDWGGPLPV
jgi:hypothetical protein